MRRRGDRLAIRNDQVAAGDAPAMRNVPLDAIRIDAVSAAVQAGDAVDTDGEVPAPSMRAPWW